MTTMEVDDSVLNDEFVLSTTFTMGTEVGVRSGAVLRVGAADSSSSSSETTAVLVLGDQMGGMAAFDLKSRDMSVLEPHHNGHAVTALLGGDHHSPANDDKDSGEESSMYATGCKGNMIRVFRATSDGSHELLKELKGHDRPVTSLAWAKTSGAAGSGDGGGCADGSPSARYLVSGSWDGTAKVWNLDNYSLVATLPGHENSVCVAGLPSSSDSVLRVATGSAGVAQNGTIGNHTVRIWSIDVRTGHAHVEHTVVQDHDGPIRDLCSFVDSQAGPVLATCSNDGTVKIRDPVTATTLSTLSFASAQHPPMLLSVIALSGGQPNETVLVTGAEDGTVVVFNLTKSDAQPQVLLHPSCVWNVVAMPGGDFGACCQDGHFYVYTRAPSRMADAATRQAFEDTVREAHRKLQSGPSSEDIAKLLFWHEAATMRGRSEGQVQLFQRDGIAIAAQWSVASQTWIEVGQVMGGPGGSGGDEQGQGMLDGVRYDHVLPIQVDTANSGTVNLQLGYNNGENPFVAAQRFIDAHVLPQYHLADIADYITQRVGSSARMLGSGPAGSMPAATTGVPLASYVHLPAKAYKTFDVTEKTASSTLEKIKTKIESFQLLSPDQLTTLSSLLDTLRGTNRYHASKISNPELDLVANMLQSFALAQSYPALDVARMCVLHPDATSQSRSQYWSKMLETVADLNVRASGDEASSLDTTAQVAIPMLSLRLLSNAFKGGPGSRDAVTNRIEDLVLPLLQSHVASTNKNVRLSVATLLHNVCFFLHSTTAPISVVTGILALCRDVLSNRSYEGEAILRVLVAVGTLVMGTSNGTAAKGAASTLYLAAKVELAASPHGAEVKAAAKEVYTVLA